MLHFRSFPLVVLVASSALAAAQNGPQFEGELHELFGDARDLALVDWTGDGLLDLVALHATANAVSFAPGEPGGTFGTAVLLASPTGPSGLATGDVDADGDVDLAYVRQEDGVDFLTVLRADGAGAFTAVSSLASSSPDYVILDLELGDLDGDGDLDAAAMLYPKAWLGVAHQGFVTALLGDGAGGFSPAGTFAIGALPRAIAMADFDADGTPDLAAANAGSSDVSVLLGDGAGGFTAAAAAPIVGAHSLAVDDVNGDGHLDLVVGRTTAGIGVLLGDGLGGFSVQVEGSGAPLTTVATGDADGDGDVDVLGGSGGLRTFLGDGTGGFPVALESDLPNTIAVATGDLDGDGRLDVAVGMSTFGTIVLLGDGSGAYADFFTAEADGDWVLTADLDGDGRADVVAPGFHEVRVFQGDGAGALELVDVEPTDVESIAGAVADLDGDGDLDVATANTEFFSFGPTKNGLSVLLGDGAGDLAAGPDFALPDGVQDQPTGIAAGDLDGDGAAELAVAFLGDRVELFSATTGAPVSLGSIAVTGPRGVELFDLDLDGALDLAVSSASGSVVVHAGDGAGGFASGTVLPCGVTPTRVRAGDVDADGLVDLAVLREGGVFGSTSVALFGGLGGGTFAAPGFTALPSQVSRSLDLADVDGDGLLDAVVLGASLFVAKGRAGAPFDEPAAYFHQFGRDAAAADLDGDGFLDVVGVGANLRVHRNRAVTPAGIAAYGIGTPGCEGVHLALADGPPVLGAPFTLTCNQAPPLGLGVRFASLGQDLSGTVLLDVLVHVDPLAPAFFMVPASANASGIAIASTVLPASPALAGVSVHEQWAWFWSPAACAPSALGLSTSRAMTLTLTL